MKKRCHTRRRSRRRCWCAVNKTSLLSAVKSVHHVLSTASSTQVSPLLWMFWKRSCCLNMSDSDDLLLRSSYVKMSRLFLEFTSDNSFSLQTSQVQLLSAGCCSSLMSGGRAADAVVRPRGSVCSFPVTWGFCMTSWITLRLCTLKTFFLGQPIALYSLTST